MDPNSLQGTVAPQYSPDGKWWCNGQGWVALPAAPLNPGFSTPDPGSRGLAIASLISSLAWVGGLGSGLGIVLGHLSRRQDRKVGARPNGVALAGLIIGYVGLGLTVMSIVLAVAIPVFLSQRESNNGAALKGQLMSASTAQYTWAVDTETFTTSAADLRTAGYLPNPEVAIEIISADATSFCLKAASRSFDDVMYYSAPDGTFSSVPCG